jgi:hypothetical protein
LQAQGRRLAAQSNIITYMKRDMDLIREILLQAEECPAGTRWTAKPLLDHSISDVVEHVQLLIDAGFVDGRTLGNEAAMILRITHAGHEFIDSSREPTRWEKAKAKALSAGAPLTVTVLKAILDQLIKEHLPHIL